MPQIEIDGTKHEVGDGVCPECYDKPVICQCGGLIHSTFGDEDYEGNCWLYYKCDKCESTDMPT